MSVAAERPEPGSERGPFKFLDFYTEDDQALLAGRERELQRVAAELLRSRTYVLYGRSGIGKTSFLLAALFPALRERGYRPIYVRMLTEPVADLERAVAAELGEGTAPVRNLRPLLVRLSASEPLIVTLDQFEEFFIRFRERPETRRQFIDTIARLLADPGLDVRILFSLRQDYLAEMDDFRDVLPNLFEHEFRLRSLSAFGARRSIANQLKAYGVPYEPQFLLRVVDELDAYDFDPTVLQILCSEVYRRAAERSSGEVRLTVADVEAVGKLSDIFLRSLERLARALPARLQLTARSVLDGLITRERTKQAVTLADFEGSPLLAEPEDVREVLDALVEHRLVRREWRDQETWYELIHERLVPVIRGWLDLDEEFLKFRLAQRLVENMSRGEAWRGQPEALAAPGQLALVRPYRERLRLAPAELEFLFRSAVYRRVDTADQPVTYWGERLGRERSVTLLEALIEDPDPPVRAAAAWAVRHFPERQLVAACTRGALRDDDPTARQAARETVAVTGGWGDGDELRQALGQAETREAAFEGLVSLYRAGSPLPRLRPWQRFWVGRTARRRVAQEHAEAIRARAKDGARQGMVAATVWMAAIGAPLALLTLWTSGELITGPGAFDPTLLGGLAVVLLPLGTALGALLGWRLSMTAAREWKLRPGSGWFRPVAWSGTLLLIVLAPTLPGLFIASLMGCFALLVAPIAGWPWVLLIAALVGLSSWAVRPSRTRTEAWAWSLAAAAGPPLLLPFLVAHGASFASADAGELAPIAALIGAVLSFSTFLAVRILDQVELAADRPQPRPGRVGWSRSAAALSVLVLVFGYLGRVGLDTLPITRAARDIAPGGMLALDDELGPGHPDPDYYRLRSTAPLTLLQQLGGSTAVPLHVAGEQIDEGETLLLPRGAAMLRVGPLASAASPWRQVDYDIRLAAPPLVDLGTPTRLGDEDWAFARVELPLFDSAETPPADERGEVEGLLEPGSWEVGEEGVVVLFFQDNPIVSDPDRPGATLLSRLEGGTTLSLVLPETGQEISLSFQPGPTVNSLAGGLLVSDLPAEIDREGRWSLPAFLMPGQKPYGAEEHPLAALRGKRDGRERVTLLVGLRLGRWAVQDGLRALESAESLVHQRDVAGAADEYAKAAELAEESGDVALNRAVCQEGTFDGFAAQVADACDWLVAEQGSEQQHLLDRTVNRALRGELEGAADDLRTILQDPSRERSAEWLERGRGWLAALEGGDNPFDARTLEALETEQTWGDPFASTTEAVEAAAVAPR